jgi:hypothetical protein
MEFDLYEYKSFLYLFVYFIFLSIPVLFHIISFAKIIQRRITG